MTINYDIMEKFGVRFWQIAQTGPLSIEVRYVPTESKPGDTAPLERALKVKAKREDIIVTFRQVDDIPRRPGGKHISYIYEVPAGDA
jgi:hypothetical protein